MATDLQRIEKFYNFDIDTREIVEFSTALQFLIQRFCMKRRAANQHNQHNPKKLGFSFEMHACLHSSSKKFIDAMLKMLKID